MLDGTADANAPVQLQLHSDDADAVQRFLEEHRIPAESRTRRLRLDRERNGEFPVWLFSAEDLTFDLTVLPYDALRQAPLSQLDEKPMPRASAAQVRQLLTEGEVSDGSPLLAEWRSVRTRAGADDPEIPSRHAMPLRSCSFDLGAGATDHALALSGSAASVAASRLGRLASTRQVSGGSAQEPQCPSGTCRLHAPPLAAAHSFCRPRLA